MPAEGMPWIPREEILSFAEIERLVRLLVGLGIHDVRLNRLRLTADGRLRTCLFSRHETDLRGPLRGGEGDAELERIVATRSGARS
jgi:molybdenum cofactor biosynthesis enzyme MoaA